jgi:hypothetical protein
VISLSRIVRFSIRRAEKQLTFLISYSVLLAPASGQQTAGIDFSPDGTRFYLNFYGGGTWQFWREDGLSFEFVPGV